MFHRPERKLDVGISQWVVQALGRLALTFAVIVGVLILAGGEQRFGSQSYAIALTYPGAPHSWGYVALASGVLGMVASLLGYLRWVWWSLMLLSIWALFFAISFAQTAYLDPHSSTTAIAVYAYVAVSSLIVGVAHRDSIKV
jgi:hypothetical protein